MDELQECVDLWAGDLRQVVGVMSANPQYWSSHVIEETLREKLRDIAEDLSKKDLLAGAEDPRSPEEIRLSLCELVRVLS